MTVPRKCFSCGKVYANRHSLCRHKKTCNGSVSSVVRLPSNIPTSKGDFGENSGSGHGNESTSELSDESAQSDGDRSDEDCIPGLTDTDDNDVSSGDIEKDEKKKFDPLRNVRCRDNDGGKKKKFDPLRGTRKALTSKKTTFNPMLPLASVHS